MKNAHSEREQDDQGKTVRRSTVTPASAGRVAAWDKQRGNNDSNSFCWSSEEGKVMSQVTKANPRPLIGKWASPEDRAGPIPAVSQARSGARVCVCTQDGA